MNLKNCICNYPLFTLWLWEHYCKICAGKKWHGQCTQWGVSMPVSFKNIKVRDSFRSYEKLKLFYWKLFNLNTWLAIVPRLKRPDHSSIIAHVFSNSWLSLSHVHFVILPNHCFLFAPSRISISLLINYIP